ncbi:hypothetical protein WJX81_005185 [Elliptochloris bilobata]|uniref:Uncharacterized protein n=1 Tax=Elliptochloris bilobata TaxID=381761 RepID=A0AAW1QNM7_9CHLO
MPSCSACTQRLAPNIPRLRRLPATQASPGDTGQQTDSGLLQEEELLQRDMARYQQRASAAPQSPLPAEQGAAPSALDAAKDALDKLLIADFFAVLAILAWLGVGVAAKVTLDSSALLDAWFPLWPLVFQPAIGVLMLGALVSGAVGWARENSSGG